MMNSQRIAVAAAVLLTLLFVSNAEAVLLVPPKAPKVEDPPAAATVKQYPPGDLTPVLNAANQNGPCGPTKSTFIGAQPLPEPGTLALLVTALAGLGLGAKRKKPD